MPRELHVAVTGNDLADGTAANPYRTISKAAQTAMAGDTVIVHGGTYREWVSPENSGRNNNCRITYTAAMGEHVVIKGSERIQGWEKVSGTTWKAVVPNDMFGDWNPYTELIDGDWMVHPAEYRMHAGDVYLNGKSFYEARSVDEVMEGSTHSEGFNPPWNRVAPKLLHPEDTAFQWYAQVDQDNTVIYANFQGADPNEELTEINVRKCCFYPRRTGRNYITVRGFEMAQAACPWTPPTADQPGLLGAHWSKGWIIENNDIHDAKCSAVSLGKEETTGHNMCARTWRKPGYQYQMEAVFRARQNGWSRETVGSHIVRNNVIHDCGQNGIVGHMGCAFSEIAGNHIYNIAVKHEFYGYEIAGIKFHAAIDVHIHNNRIHNCTLGTWLDWQAQGARVSKNLYYSNDRDLFMEVTHGPYLVDNNIFASEYNFDNVAQGGAYVNNLCCGFMRRAGVPDRSTPYHFPHTTQVAGSVVVYGADDRFFQNIFIGGCTFTAESASAGTDSYNGCPASMEEYISCVTSQNPGDLERFLKVQQPVYVNCNAYYNGAGAYDREETNLLSQGNPNVSVIEEGNEVYLEFSADQELLDLPAQPLCTASFEPPRITEAPYEDALGRSILLDTDLTGVCRRPHSTVGPIEQLSVGYNRIKVWG